MGKLSHTMWGLYNKPNKFWAASPEYSSMMFCSSHAGSCSCLKIKLSKKPSSHQSKNKAIYLVRHTIISQNMSFKMKTYFYSVLQNLHLLCLVHIKVFVIWRLLEAKKIHHALSLKGYQIITTFVDSVFLILVCSLLLWQTAQKTVMGQPRSDREDSENQTPSSDTLPLEDY